MAITFNIDNGNLIVGLPVSLSEKNSCDIYNTVNDLLNKHELNKAIIDFDKVKNITIDGIDMLLNLSKKLYKMSIINVSEGIYPKITNAFDLTDVKIERAYRKISVEGCPIIGKGSKGTVYRYSDEIAVKVYKNPNSLAAIRQERYLALKAFELKIPTAISYEIVKVGNKYGTVFELIDAKSLSELISEEPYKMEFYLDKYAEMLNLMHSTIVEDKSVPNAINYHVGDWLRVSKPYMEEADFNKLSKMVSEIPDELSLLHCDFQTNNIMYQYGQPVIIDMDTLAYGHPIFDLACIHYTYVSKALIEPNDVKSFLNMSESLYSKVWDMVLPRYFNTLDLKKLEPIDKKIQVLSYLRLFRYVINKYKDSKPDFIKVANDNLHRLLQEVDNLYW